MSSSDDLVASVNISAPKADDVSELISLINALAGEENFLFINPVDSASGIAILRDHLDAIAKNANEAVLIARVGTEIVGMVTGSRGAHPARRGSIEIGLGVLPNYRRRGIGGALLRALERWSVAAGCHRLQLHVVTENVAAIGLYQKYGFSVEGLLYATALIAGQYYNEFEMAKLLGLGG